MASEETQQGVSGPTDNYDKLRIALATELDREVIYKLRHDVFAAELGQHPANAEGRLSDSLDEFNTYVIATLGGEVAGFISITPPGSSYQSILAVSSVSCLLA